LKKKVRRVSDFEKLPMVNDERAEQTKKKDSGKKTYVNSGPCRDAGSRIKAVKQQTTKKSLAGRGGVLTSRKKKVFSLGSRSIGNNER